MQFHGTSQHRRLFSPFALPSHPYALTQNGTRVKVDEKMYPLGFDAEDVIHQLSNMKSHQIDKAAPILLQKFPNTHSLTKALAEYVLSRQRDRLPLAIIRPGILGATHSEPFQGFVDGLSVVGTMMAYTGLGVVKFLPGDPNNVVDLVPVDKVAALVLAVAAVRALHPPPVTRVPIYHATTSGSNPLKWGIATTTAVRYWQRHPPKKGVSPSSVYMIPNQLGYRTQFALKYQAPSAFYSAMSKVLKSDFHKKQADQLNKVVDRASRMNRAVKPFVSNEWIFSSTATEELRREFLSERDSQVFDFDCRNIDWHHYINFYCFGLQKYVLKEDVEQPQTRDLKVGRMLSRDIEGRIDRKLFSDVEFAIRSSRHVPHPTLSQLRQIKKEVLASPAVLRAMKQVAEQKSIPEEVMQKMAKDILKRMQTKMQVSWVRTLAWFFRKVWRAIYQQLDVNEQSMLQLAEAIKKGPVVLIPSHRSYIDFIILSYVLFAYNLPIPVIAAGEDFLNLSFVSNVLRFAGAFFLRRTFRGDVLYNAIFTEYVQRLVLLGCPMEFFIEGTRSRSGKLLQPKLGLLGIVTDVFYERKLDELTFVPISSCTFFLICSSFFELSYRPCADINYENVIEDEAYTREWLGEPKKKESLENLLKASQILSQNYGRISLKFGDPISLKEYTDEYTQLMKETRNPKFDPFQHHEDRKDVNIALAHQLIYDINAQSVWAPLAIVGSLLLTYRTGILRQHLSDKVEWLVNEISRRQTGYEEWMVEHPPAQMTSLALERVQAHIEDRKDMISCPDKNGVLLLAFYRNRLIHLFVRDSFLMTAFGSLVDGDVSDASLRDCGVSVQDLFGAAEFLVHVIGKEFVYKVHPHEEEGFDQVLEDLITNKILERLPSDPSRVRLHTTEHARSAFNFYAGLLWPFVEAYWVACLTLYALRPSATQMQPLLQRMQWMAESLIAEGRSGFYETCSIETLKNAVHAFHHMKVMRFDNFGEVIAISKDYAESNASKLKALLLRLGSLRRRAKDKGVTEIGVPKSLLEDFPIRAKL